MENQSGSLKKSTVIILSALIITIMGVLAAITVDITMNIYLRSGKVEIDLTQEDTIKPIEAGQTQQRTFNITCLEDSEPCWVRLNYDLTSGDLKAPGVINRQLSDPDWYLAPNGRWYLQRPLEKGETIKLTFDLTIPNTNEWHEALKEDKLEVTEKIVGEAIQSAGFAPDWSLDGPWGGKPIESYAEVKPELRESSE